LSFVLSPDCFASIFDDHEIVIKTKEVEMVADESGGGANEVCATGVQREEIVVGCCQRE
jgi:hypothetical protein